MLGTLESEELYQPVESLRKQHDHKKQRTQSNEEEEEENEEDDEEEEEEAESPAANARTMRATMIA
jgi:hypothetical protein